MLDSQNDGCSHSIGAHTELNKAFDLRAKFPLELELRLDRFNEAVQARGGRVLVVSRGRAAAGGYCAAVRYCLPLPREASPSHSASRLRRETRPEA